MIADGFYRTSELLYHEIANDLRRAITWTRSGSSDRLAYLPQLDGSYKLMIAYCLENMIKGCAIAANPALVQPEKVSSEITNHNLHLLIRKIPLRWTSAEVELLENLSECIVWLAKYPLPKDSSKLVESHGHSYQGLRKSFLEIYRKLTEYLQTFPSLNQHLHSYTYSRR